MASSGAELATARGRSAASCPSGRAAGIGPWPVAPVAQACTPSGSVESWPRPEIAPGRRRTRSGHRLPRMAFEVRAAQPGEKRAVVPLYEWLFAPPGSRPGAWDERRAAVALREAIDSARRLSCWSPRAARGADRLLHRLPGHPLGPLRLPGLGRGSRGRPRPPLPRRRQALLDAARDWARERGATHLELDSARGARRRAPLLRARGRRLPGDLVRLGALTRWRGSSSSGPRATPAADAEALVARGARPLLAARSAAKLDALARRSGRRARDHGRRRRRSGVGSGAGRARRRDRRHGRALRPPRRPRGRGGGRPPGLCYLDSTGEPAFIRSVFERFGPQAERSGARRW